MRCSFALVLLSRGLWVRKMCDGCVHLQVHRDEAIKCSRGVFPRTKPNVDHYYDLIYRERKCVQFLAKKGYKEFMERGKK